LNPFGAKQKIVDWDYFKIKYFNEINHKENQPKCVNSEKNNTGMTIVAKECSQRSYAAIKGGV